MTQLASTHVNGAKSNYVEANGIKLHYVEMGSGPTVLLLHGFPDFWYSYRYQIPALANAGYHVVVPDLRGFGESEIPETVDQYTPLHEVGDFIALLDLLEVKQAVVVGHDWGAVYAGDICHMRPDRVKAVVFLSVPYINAGRFQGSLLDSTKEVGEHFYINQFQKPGVAEALFAKATTANVLKSFLLRWHDCKTLAVPDFSPNEADDPLPEYLSEEDLKYYVETFEKTGFTGGFNHYRAITQNSKLRAPWAGKPIDTPAMTVLADRDMVTWFPGVPEFISDPEAVKAALPNQQKFVKLNDCGHFMHFEKHEEVNQLLLEFLARYRD